MAVQNALEPSSRSHSRACTQISRASPNLSPSSSFDQHSPFHSASFADRSTPPYAYYSNLDNRTHPPNTSTSRSHGSDSSQRPTAPSSSPTPTNVSDATRTTSPVRPAPYSWASNDSSDFECAVAGEYSPYARDFSEQQQLLRAAPASAAPPGAPKPEPLTMKPLPVLPPHQQHRTELPVNNPSFDIAYFLKNTGPPSRPGASPTELDGGRRKNRLKSPLRFLRVGGRKDPVARGGGVECTPDADKDTPPTFFKPLDNVIQKISKDGKKYLQIIANEKTAPTRQVEIPKRISSKNQHRKQRLSVTFSETTETASTDELDTWLLTLSLHKQAEEKLQFEKNKEKSIKLVEEEEHRDTRKERDKLLGGKREGSKEGCDQKALKSSHVLFGLSPVEQPKIAVTYSEALDAMAAPFSNPLSMRQSTADAVDVSSNTKDGEDSDNDSLPDFPQPPYSEESRNSSKRGKERLAGQGMRRPSLEQGKPATSRSDSLSKDSTSGNSHIREDSGVGKMPHADPSVFGLGAKDSIRKGREEMMRARKLRDPQRTRNNIDEVLEQYVDGMTLPELAIETAPTATPTENCEVELESLNETQPQSQLESRTQDDSDTRHPSVDTLSTAPTLRYSTGYAPMSGRICLTPIMLVAEQIPMSKPKVAKKPARLVLRERRTPTTLAVAVREAAESAAESAPATSSGIENEIKETGAATSPSDTGTTADVRRAKQEHKLADGPILPFVSSQTSPQAFELEKAMERQGSARHRSAPRAVSSPAPDTAAAQNSAVVEVADSAPAGAGAGAGAAIRHKHTPSHASRAGIASSLLSPSSAFISASRETRLEARVEMLERENKLLEAALMAVLKSGGRLNKCPCRLSVREGGAGAGVGTRAKVGRESVDSVGMVGTEGSRVSALKVYLGTRTGRGGWE